MHDLAQKILKALVANDCSCLVNFTAMTEVALTGGKANEHQGRVIKTVEFDAHLMCGAGAIDYAKVVRNRLVAEGKDPADYIPLPRRWGKRISGTPFLELGDETYLEVFFVSAPRNILYFLDGWRVEKAEIVGLPSSRKPSESSQGGLREKVVVRTYKLSSLIKVVIGGKTIYKK